VQAGGALVYIVCSLLPEEGEAQVAAFLRRNAAFTSAPFSNPTGGPAVNSLVLTPEDHGCDGFYIARLTTV
jgi:16S rRNA (cytosine967-C5)-methyltransferase